MRHSDEQVVFERAVARTAGAFYCQNLSERDARDALLAQLAY